MNAEQTEQNRTEQKFYSKFVHIVHHLYIHLLRHKYYKHITDDVRYVQIWNSAKEIMIL